ncbi:MAG: hypothetical protein KDE63_12685 [Novosphingobium sp.]|nr:hypothetical protein [Novosphingobium sp.]
MSTLFVLSGSPQPIANVDLTTSSRTTLLSNNKQGETWKVGDIGATNDQSTDKLLTVEISPDNGSSYKVLWKGTITANSGNALGGLPRPIILPYNHILAVTAETGDFLHVNAAYVVE